MSDQELIETIRQALAQLAEKPALWPEVCRGLRAVANTHDPCALRRGLRMLESTAVKCEAGVDSYSTPASLDSPCPDGPCHA